MYDSPASANASNPLAGNALGIPRGYEVEVFSKVINKKYPNARRAKMDTSFGVKEGYVNVTDFE